MTQEEAIKQMEYILEDLFSTYKEYNPRGNYLHITFLDGAISMTNEYWGADRGTPLRYFKEGGDSCTD